METSTSAPAPKVKLTKKVFVTGAKTKLGNRRTNGCGDTVGRQLLACTNIVQMVDVATKLGLNPKDVRQYKQSNLHLGIVRMAIGNRIRAFLRKKEAEKLNKKKRTVEVLS